jgi:hypothetical protein
MGEERTRRYEMLQVRLYRMAFAVCMVAVFLEGLGAGFKWD